MQTACMAVNITIRDVPERVRAALASRAARQGKSMQEYLRQELDRMVSRPSVDDWLTELRKRKRHARSGITAQTILQHKDADRR